MHITRNFRKQILEILKKFQDKKGGNCTFYETVFTFLFRKFWVNSIVFVTKKKNFLFFNFVFVWFVFCFYHAFISLTLTIHRTGGERGTIPSSLLRLPTLSWVKSRQLTSALSLVDNWHQSPTPWQVRYTAVSNAL